MVAASSEVVWDRTLLRRHRKALFIYPENHRDFLAMSPVKVSKRTCALWVGGNRTRRQQKGKANIRGELNAFPLRTAWFSSLPDTDFPATFFSDKHMHENLKVLENDLQRAADAFSCGVYNLIVMPDSGLLSGGKNDLLRRAPETQRTLLNMLKDLDKREQELLARAKEWREQHQENCEFYT